MSGYRKLVTQLEKHSQRVFRTGSCVSGQHTAHHPFFEAIANEMNCPFDFYPLQGMLWHCSAAR